MLVAIEGIDGSGKSTVIGLVADTLRKEGVDLYVTQEPSNSEVGRLVRGWALKHSVDPHVDALLFAADRLHHYVTEIAPALRRGEVVITERYLESSVAYQGALGVDVAWILEINRHVPWPDLTIVLDVDPREALRRVAARGGRPDKYEVLHVLSKAREMLIRRSMELGYVVVDAGRGPGEVAAEVAWHIRKKLKERRHADA